MPPPTAAILHSLATAATQTRLPPDATRRGLALSTLAALLGITLVCCAALLVFMNARRRRRAQRTERPAVATPDPWVESAKRITTDDEDPV